MLRADGDTEESRNRLGPDQPAHHEPVYTTKPTAQTSPNAANRLCITMVAVKLSFTWFGVRKTLGPEQRTTAARALHADRDLRPAG